MADNAQVNIPDTAGVIVAMAVMNFSGDTAGFQITGGTILTGSEGSWVQTLIVGGAGAVTGGVQRVTLASDDPAVALLATLATESGGNLDSIATDVGLSAALLGAWDESDRAKVNLIVGQAGIAAGEGIDGTTVLRMTMATDVGLPAGINAIGMINGMASTVDDTNSSTTPLLSGATFTGTPTDTLNYSHITMSVFSDQISATDGLSIEWSSDGTNWDNFDRFTVPESEGKVFSFGPVSRWMRVVYTNGGVNQGAFRLETILRVGQMSASSHRISDSISPEDDAELVKAIITGLAPDSTFKNLLVTNAGEMKVSIESVNGARLPITSNTAKDASGTEYSPILDSDGHFQMDTLKVGSVIDANNSTTTPLGGGATFEPANGTDLLGYSAVCVTIFADVDSAAMGMTFEFSTDDTNWDDVYAFTLDVSTDTTRRFQFPVTARYFRVSYTNGAGAQSAFRMQTILHTANQLTSIHRLDDDMDPDRSAQIVKAVLFGKGQGGSPDFKPVDVTNGGNLKVSVEESVALSSGTDTVGGVISQLSTSTMYDGTAAVTIKRATGIAVSGTTAMVSAVAAKKIRILALFLKATSSTVTNVYVANADFDIIGNAANPMPLAVDADGDNDSGFVLPFNQGGWAETDTVNEDLSLILSAAEDVIFLLTYIEVD